MWAPHVVVGASADYCNKVSPRVHLTTPYAHSLSLAFPPYLSELNFHLPSFSALCPFSNTLTFSSSLFPQISDRISRISLITLFSIGSQDREEPSRPLDLISDKNTVAGRGFWRVFLRRFLFRSSISSSREVRFLDL